MVLVVIWPSTAKMVQLIISLLSITIKHPRIVMCSRVVWSLAQPISALCYVETMTMVLVAIWPSRAIMVQIVIFFFRIIFKDPRIVMASGKSGHFGAKLCRDYEVGLGDHNAIMDHDGPNSFLLSLNYI